MDPATSRDQNIVTLDGPAGSGKSTVARRLADRLGYRFLDTGAMYRAATLACMDAGLDLDPPDPVAAAAALEAAGMSLAPDGAVLLAGEKVESRIRTEEVARNVSAVAAIREVRAQLTRMQREFGVNARPGLVAEGRDMATVVFPDARHRFYLDASLEVRARRRLGDLARAGQALPQQEEMVAAIRERDRKDSSREVAPLRVGQGVQQVDTSLMIVDEVVDQLAGWVLAEVRE